jgi:hypothetical protein
MLDLEPIKVRLLAAVESHISAPAPASNTYTASQARTDIAALIDELERLRAALQAQVDDAVEESDTRYWASLVLDDPTYDGKSVV